MTLFYRGIPYQTQTNTVNTNKTQTVAKYRGQVYHVSYAQTMTTANIEQNSMTYRGVNY